MPATTPRIGLPYPLSSDSNNIPQDIQRLAAAFDTIGVVFLQGALSARPTAAVTGRFYAATDLTPAAIYYDTGAAWVLSNGSITSAFTAKGDVLAATGPGAPARVGIGVDGTSLVARASYASGVGWEPVLGYPLALPGATAAARFVGGTASGPPNTGTFAVGDVSISQDGNQWVCTAAGAPGSFTQIGGVGNQCVQAMSTATGAAGGTSPTPSGDTTAVAATSSLTVTNPSSARSMLVRATLQGFMGWPYPNPNPTSTYFYNAFYNVDLRLNGTTIDAGRTPLYLIDGLPCYVRDLSATTVIVPPAGNVTFAGVVSAGVTMYASTSQSYYVNSKAYLTVAGWTI